MSNSPKLKVVAPKTFAIYYDMEIVANGHDTDPRQIAKDVVASVKSTTLEDLKSHLEELRYDDYPFYQKLVASLRSEGLVR